MDTMPQPIKYPICQEEEKKNITTFACHLKHYKSLLSHMLETLRKRKWPNNSIKPKGTDTGKKFFYLSCKFRKTEKEKKKKQKNENKKKKEKKINDEQTVPKPQTIVSDTN
ncbi:hypothetical protein RFI_12370 [Reticulomyxa filosa]|uniref:Uncharacterized protein n=1 Tax=Reticulomyxa filosa TaxID=46433 RepID=X6NFP0_RETFI|nr:hypothetical protein RFI_12370 [Reticulomyxa filosa]|eukprot:ETO24786.1 hypothetical protein RFI_12370 [Reticulomyxa filosa]